MTFYTAIFITNRFSPQEFGEEKKLLYHSEIQTQTKSTPVKTVTCHSSRRDKPSDWVDAQKVYMPSYSS